MQYSLMSQKILLLLFETVSCIQVRANVTPSRTKEVAFKEYGRIAWHYKFKQLYNRWFAYLGRLFEFASLKN